MPWFFPPQFLEKLQSFEEEAYSLLAIADKKSFDQWCVQEWRKILWNFFPYFTSAKENDSVTTWYEILYDRYKKKQPKSGGLLPKIQTPSLNDIYNLLILEKPDLLKNYPVPPPTYSLSSDEKRNGNCDESFLSLMKAIHLFNRDYTKYILTPLKGLRLGVVDFYTSYEGIIKQAQALRSREVSGISQDKLKDYININTILLKFIDALIAVPEIAPFVELANAKRRLKRHLLNYLNTKDDRKPSILSLVIEEAIKFAKIKHPNNKVLQKQILEKYIAEVVKEDMSAVKKAILDAIDAIKEEKAVQPVIDEERKNALADLLAEISKKVEIGKMLNDFLEELWNQNMTLKMAQAEFKASQQPLPDLDSVIPATQIISSSVETPLEETLASPSGGEITPDIKKDDSDKSPLLEVRASVPPEFSAESSSDSIKMGRLIQEEIVGEGDPKKEDKGSEELVQYAEYSTGQFVGDHSVLFKEESRKETLNSENFTIADKEIYISPSARVIVQPINIPSEPLDISESEVSELDDSESVLAPISSSLDQSRSVLDTRKRADIYSLNAYLEDRHEDYSENQGATKILEDKNISLEDSIIDLIEWIDPEILSKEKSLEKTLLQDAPPAQIEALAAFDLSLDINLNSVPPISEESQLYIIEEPSFPPSPPSEVVKKVSLEAQICSDYHSDYKQGKVPAIELLKLEHDTHQKVVAAKIQLLDKLLAVKENENVNSILDKLETGDKFQDASYIKHLQSGIKGKSRHEQIKFFTAELSKFKTYVHKLLLQENFENFVNLKTLPFYKIEELKAEQKSLDSAILSIQQSRETNLLVKIEEVLTKIVSNNEKITTVEHIFQLCKETSNEIKNSLQKSIGGSLWELEVKRKIEEQLPGISAEILEEEKAFLQVKQEFQNKNKENHLQIRRILEEYFLEIKEALRSKTQEITQSFDEIKFTEVRNDYSLVAKILQLRGYKIKEENINALQKSLINALQFAEALKKQLNIDPSSYVRLEFKSNMEDIDVAKKDFDELIKQKKDACNDLQKENALSMGQLAQAIEADIEKEYEALNKLELSTLDNEDISITYKKLNAANEALAKTAQLLSWVKMIGDTDKNQALHSKLEKLFSTISNSQDKNAKLIQASLQKDKLKSISKYLNQIITLLKDEKINLVNLEAKLPKIADNNLFKARSALLELNTAIVLFSKKVADSEVTIVQDLIELKHILEDDKTMTQQEKSVYTQEISHYTQYLKQLYVFLTKAHTSQKEYNTSLWDTFRKRLVTLTQQSTNHFDKITREFKELTVHKEMKEEAMDGLQKTVKQLALERKRALAIEKFEKELENIATFCSAVATFGEQCDQLTTEEKKALSQEISAFGQEQTALIKEVESIQKNLIILKAKNYKFIRTSILICEQGIDRITEKYKNLNHEFKNVDSKITESEKVIAAREILGQLGKLREEFQHLVANQSNFKPALQDKISLLDKNLLTLHNQVEKFCDAIATNIYESINKKIELISASLKSVETSQDAKVEQELKKEQSLGDLNTSLNKLLEDDKANFEALPNFKTILLANIKLIRKDIILKSIDHIKQSLKASLELSEVKDITATKDAMFTLKEKIYQAYETLKHEDYKFVEENLPTAAGDFAAIERLFDEVGVRIDEIPIHANIDALQVPTIGMLTQRILQSKEVKGDYEELETQKKNLLSYGSLSQKSKEKIDLKNEAYKTNSTKAKIIAEAVISQDHNIISQAFIEVKEENGTFFLKPKEPITPNLIIAMLKAIGEVKNIKVNDTSLNGEALLIWKKRQALSIIRLLIEVMEVNEVLLLGERLLDLSSLMPVAQDAKNLNPDLVLAQALQYLREERSSWRLSSHGNTETWFQIMRCIQIRLRRENFHRGIPKDEDDRKGGEVKASVDGEVVEIKAAAVNKPTSTYTLIMHTPISHLGFRRGYLSLFDSPPDAKTPEEQKGRPWAQGKHK